MKASFYRLDRTPIERALPSLLERSLKEGLRVLLRAPSEERARDLDDLLWTYRQESFLPHGMAKDGDPETQPIYITVGDENPNKATLLALVYGAEPFGLEEFARCLYLYDGRDSEACLLAERHQGAMGEGVELALWRQASDGSWQEEDAKEGSP